MGPIKCLIMLFFCVGGAVHASPNLEVTGSVEEMVERINQRYDDFFRWHRQQEERWKRFEVGTQERKKMEKEHAEKLEHARVAYIKARRERPSDEPLRIKWEKEQKERQEHIEMLRRRYVDQRDTIEKYLKKGRQIPEMKEYDLEGY